MNYTENQKTSYSKNLGFYYLLMGLKTIFNKNVRKFVIIPFFINVLLFSLGLYLIINKSGELSNYVDAYQPNWLSSITSWVIYIFTTLLYICLFFYLCLTITNICSAPFNGIIASKTEEIITGNVTDSQLKETLKDVPRMILHAIHVSLYTLPRALCTIVFLLIPLGYAIWFAFSSWYIIINYLDCPGDNHKLKLKQLLKIMRKHRLTCLCFGLCINGMLLIPIVNFIVIPIAVCGSTYMLADFTNNFEELDNKDMEQDKQIENKTELTVNN